jgi:hypothetical protein
MALYRPRGGGFKATSCNHRISLRDCLREAPTKVLLAELRVKKDALVWAMLSAKAERLSKGLSLALCFAQVFPEHPRRIKIPLDTICSSQIVCGAL